MEHKGGGRSIEEHRTIHVVVIAGRRADKGLETYKVENVDIVIS